MTPVRASGAPRDLGRDQGTALGAAIRAAVGVDSLAGRFGWSRGDPATQRLHRDLRRYFPHQSEWLEGMARAAGVSQAALVRALAESCGPDGAPAAIVAAAAGAARRLACPPVPGAVVRHVEPEGRFASLELALPVASAPLLGVNEAGLAVAVAPRGWSPGRFAPPVALFARDCLERFERVDPALEWCLSRPAAPGGGLLLADAHGDRAAVDANGPARRALRLPGDWLALGAGDAWTKPADSRRGGDLDAALAEAFESRPADVALADPVGRRLRAAGGDWLVVPPTPAA